MKQPLLASVILFAIAATARAGEPAIALTDAWQAKIARAAPVKPRATPVEKRRALVFSLMTGFQHWVTPHTAAVVKILGEKSGAYEVVESNDVAVFEPDRIQPFDIIILNNNCSRGGRRDLFYDATEDESRALALENSLLAHIANGHGLVAIHGAIVMQNNSEEFSRMLGGSFDFHPRQQEVICQPVAPPHPLLAAFGGKPFVHVDEPYLFSKAYTQKDFRPLLQMDTSQLDCGSQTEKVRSDTRYVAWIKRYGKGRVFYCSPSHNAQSFERPELLQFLLDGIQYAAGDLPCDDTPLKRESEN